MRSVPLAFVFALLVGALAWPSQAAEPSLADKETARALFFEGDEKFRAGDYEGALEVFRGADAIMGVPTTGLEVGRTLRELGRLLEAAEILLRVTNIAQVPGESEAQERARADARLLLEEVRADIPSIQVVVNGVTASDLVVRIDGAEIPPSAQPFPRKVDPGLHTIEVEATGYRPERREVVVSPRQEERVVFIPEALARVEPQAPAPVPEAPAIEGASGEVPSWAWVGFGVGGAGIIAGAITGGMTLANVSDLEQRCESEICPVEEQDRLDEARAIAHAATGCFIVGAAGLAVGITGAIIGLTGEPEAAFVPLVGPGYAGLRARF